MSTSPGLRALSSSSVLEGQGGSDGVVVALQLQGSTALQAVYTIPVSIGGSKTFSLQVDTGSSDLWVASTSCSTSTCDDVGGGNLYNPSTSIQTDAEFSINYLSGQVNGPIVWDRVKVGGYSIDNQALAAATVVSDEPLSSSYQGILGLALPLNSVIAHAIPPVTDNTPDGAAWASNLFSLTPVSSSPAAHFLSLSLERPGSDRVPSLLGIGHHPSSLVSDPSHIKYSSLIGDNEGTRYWKITVRAITVYVGGRARPINIGNSVAGGAFPTALLDSGIPVILTTSRIANGIYGALGIGPAADGNYYVPCATPLNMTITLDNRPEIPLHPLDLTSEPADNNRAQFCIGMIQADDSAFYGPDADIGDMVLGVPFLRNTYTVMAYTTPAANGTFPNPDPAPSDRVDPALGLLPLTDPTIALAEFNTVRVLNQPLSSTGANRTQHEPSTITVGPKKLSVGITVLVALVGFFSLCVALFGLRWFLLRRKFGKGGVGLEGGDDDDDDDDDDAEEGGEETRMKKMLVLKSAGVAAAAAAGGGQVDDGESSVVGVGGPEKKSGSYSVLVRGSRSFDDDERASGELGVMDDKNGGDGDGVVEAIRINERGVSQYTASSGRTRIGDDPLGFVPNEFGYGAGAGKLELKHNTGSRWSVAGGGSAGNGPYSRSRSQSQPQSPSPSHTPFQPRPPSHERNAGLLLPLLAHHHHRHSQSSDVDGGAGAGSAVFPRFFGDEERLRESPVSAGSMAGIGTAVAQRRHSQFGSLGFPRDSVWSAGSGGTLVASPTSIPDEERRHAPSPPASAPAFPPVIASSSSVPPPRPASASASASLSPLPPTMPVDVPEETPSPPPPSHGYPPTVPSPVFIPSGAGSPSYAHARPTSLVDEFNPYAEISPR